MSSIPENQPSDAKPPKKSKWYWSVLIYVGWLWYFGGINVLLLRDIPLLLFLLGFGFVICYPISIWLKPNEPPRKLRKILVGMLWIWFVLAIAMASLLYVIPPFAISRQTTYLTEPRSKEFYGIDYQAVIEKQIDPGVPSKENGFRLLTEALGRPFFGEAFKYKHWNRLCQYLDLPTEIEPKYEFTDWRTYEKTLTPEEQELVRTPPCGNLSWSNEALPIVRRWLDDNEAAIDLFALAAQKPVLYAPPMFDGKFNTVYTNEQTFRTISGCFQMRARYWLTIGETDKAWNEVLLIYRLFDLHRPAIWDVMSTFINMAIFGIANNYAESVLLHSGWTADEILQKIKKIEPFLQPFNDDEIRNILRNERLMSLDFITQLANGIYNFSDTELPPAPNSWERFGNKAMWRFFRTELTMVKINQYFDRIEQRYFNGEPEPPDTSDNVQTIGEFMNEKYPMLDILKFVAWYGIGSVSNLMGDVMADLNRPNIESWRVSIKRRPTVIALLRLRFALEAHGRHNCGYYPSTLDALLGRYIDEIPLDPFSGEPFRYIAGEPGSASPNFLLYSVGPNGIDEEGRDHSGIPKGDDIRRQGGF
ncbi:MAG: hypothetical protein FWE67_04890 [Planctomycetaceae bacterium]|nr:hypothetical protein [Planctomycetaceae bacterium]